MNRRYIKKFLDGIGLISLVLFLLIFTDMDTISMKTETFNYNILSLDEIVLLQGGGSGTSGPCDAKTCTDCPTNCTALEIGVCRNSSGYCVHDTTQMACRCGPDHYIWTKGCSLL